MEPKIKQLEEICAGLDYEIIQDKILMANAKIGAHHYGIDLNECTPTFILKADDDFIAVIIQGNKKLDFKKLKQYLNVKKVTMATKDEIFELTGSPIGSVSMINLNLKTLLDAGIKNLKYCYGGCGVEKYTMKIKAAHLIEITRSEVNDFARVEDTHV